MQTLSKYLIFTLLHLSLFAGVNYNVELGDSSKNDYFISKVDGKLFGFGGTYDSVGLETDVMYSIVNNNQIAYSAALHQEGSQEARSALRLIGGGGYLIVGFNGINYNEKISAMVMKTDDMMNIVWMKEYSDKLINNSMAYSIKPIEDDYIVSGYYKNDDGTTSVWVYKINSDGDVLWEYKRAATAVAESKITIASDSNIYVMAKTTRPSLGLYDIEIIKLNNDGVEQWVKGFGSNKADRVANLFVSSDSSKLFCVGGNFDQIQYISLNASDGSTIINKYFDGGYSSYYPSAATIDGDVIFIGGVKDFTTSYPSAYVKAIDIYGNELGDKTLINKTYITDIEELIYSNNTLTATGKKLLSSGNYNAVSVNIDFIRPNAIVPEPEVVEPDPEPVVNPEPVAPIVSLSSDVTSLILSQSVTLEVTVDKVVQTYTWYVDGVLDSVYSNHELFTPDHSGDINITVSVVDVDDLEVNASKIINVREAQTPVTTLSKSLNKNVLAISQSSVVADGTISNETMKINSVEATTHTFTTCNESIDINLTATSSFGKVDSYNENYTFVCSDINLNASVSKTAGEEGVIIDLAASATSPNTDDAVNIEWFVDNQTIKTDSTTYTFNDAGIYVVQVRATDILGKIATESFTITINEAVVEVVNPEPVVVVSSGGSSGGSSTTIDTTSMETMEEHSSIVAEELQPIEENQIEIIGQDALDETFILEVKVGWNLIASPFNEDLDISPLEPEKTWSYENKSWIEDSNVIKAGRGMWLKVRNVDSIEITGETYDFQPSEDLAKGWHLLGGGRSNNKALEVFTYSPDSKWSKDKYVEAGHGFWYYQE
jgi:hypothetical protein